jgi:hypothetical protein
MELQPWRRFKLFLDAHLWEVSGQRDEHETTASVGGVRNCLDRDMLKRPSISIRSFSEVEIAVSSIQGQHCV